MTDEMRDLGTPDLILAGQTVDVGAGPADQLAFDDSGATARTCQMPGQKFAALPTANDEGFEVIFLRHGELRSVGSGRIVLRLPPSFRRKQESITGMARR